MNKCLKDFKGNGRSRVLSASWKVLAREENCPGPSALRGSVTSFSFLLSPETSDLTSSHLMEYIK